MTISAMLLPRAARRVRDLGDKGAVDLEPVHAQPLQVGERREARAEIGDGDRDGRAHAHEFRYRLWRENSIQQHSSLVQTGIPPSACPCW
jgi:hypothetical protein